MFSPDGNVFYSETDTRINELTFSNHPDHPTLTTNCRSANFTGVGSKSRTPRIRDVKALRKKGKAQRKARQKQRKK